MSKKLKKFLSLSIALAMVLGITACGGGQAETTAAEATTASEAAATTAGEETTPAEETTATEETTTAEETTQGAEAAKSTLVVGYSAFSQKFSPFFAKTAYDRDVADMTQLALIGNDREGNLILKGIEGETRSYNGTDYSYNGIADTEVVQNDDGTVDYNIKIREDIVFSDGKPMTIDDAIFSIYVYCDPTYDGSSTFYSLKVEGMEEYRNAMGILYKLILAAGEDNKDFTNWTEEQQTKYWAAFRAAGEKFAQEIVDYCIAQGLNKAEDSVAACAANWGFELEDNATTADLFQAIIDKRGLEFSADEKGIDYESAGSSISDLVAAELGDEAETFTSVIAVGEAVPSITGIKKTGDYSMTIHCTQFEAQAIYQVGIQVSPLHYYGDPAKYDYDNNKFGFDKGDLSVVREKTTVPMGAGPYKFVSYENGTVTYEANELFYKGKPKTQYILFKETADGDKLSGVASGTFDISDPSFSKETVDSLKTYNSNGEITGNVITTSTVDNLGYGYIGIRSETVKVGDDAGSKESKDLRKAFATLFAVHRDTVINSYYGERASVIQYPISNTSWAAPRPADEGYMIAYSVDVDGNPIYTDAMTEEEKYDAALQAVIGFLKAAGYTWDDAASKFTAAPEGAQLSYEVIVPADGVGDHPAYGILTAAKEQLATIGITLEINDPSDTNILWNALDAGTQEMWTAAWQATIDPDMYQIYHSSNAVGKGGTNSNHYAIADDELDELIIEARSSSDQVFRKATYKQCLDIILDWGCEIPSYQRQNAVIFSTERIKMETMTPDITTFYGWMAELENIEVND